MYGLEAATGASLEALIFGSSKGLSLRQLPTGQLYCPPDSNGFPTVQIFEFEKALLSRNPKYMNKVCAGEWFSKSGTLGRPKMPNPAQLITMANGVKNTLNSARHSATHLSNLCGGYDVTYIHNATHPGTNDFLEAKINMLGFATEPSLVLRDVWRQHIEKFGDKALIFHVPHSHGTPITYNALVLLPESMREKIIVSAIAPCKYVPDELCRKAFNYKTNILHDVVPFANTMYPKRDNFKYDNIITLKPPPGGGWEQHSFQNKVYEEPISARFDNFIKEGQK